MVSTVVTVVVVSYETRDHLRRCLCSLQHDAQSGFARVVVVDNGSNDGSVAMVGAEFPWATTLQAGENLGFGAAVNLGAGSAETPWLAAANADVVLPASALTDLVAAGSRHPSVGALAPRLELPSGETQRSTWRFPRSTDVMLSTLGLHRLSTRVARRLEHGAAWSDAARNVEWAMGAFLLFRRDAFAAVGGFDSSQWMYAEDLDICWRLMKAGWQTRYCSEVTVCHAGAAATGNAFSDRTVSLKLAAHYGWLERRCGRMAMARVAAMQLGGATVRLGALRLLRCLMPGRWTGAYKRVQVWREANLWALRNRGTSVAPRQTAAPQPLISQ